MSAATAAVANIADLHLPFIASLFRSFQRGRACGLTRTIHQKLSASSSYVQLIVLMLSIGSFYGGGARRIARRFVCNRPNRATAENETRVCAARPKGIGSKFDHYGNMFYGSLVGDSAISSSTSTARSMIRSSICAPVSAMIPAGQALLGPMAMRRSNARGASARNRG